MSITILYSIEYRKHSSHSVHEFPLYLNASDLSADKVIDLE